MWETKWGGSARGDVERFWKTRWEQELLDIQNTMFSLSCLSRRLFHTLPGTAVHRKSFDRLQHPPLCSARRQKKKIKKNPKQFQVPVKSVHHLVPTRNPRVGKAPRNKAQSGVVLSLHRRCWSAVTTQGGCRGSQGSPRAGEFPSAWPVPDTLGQLSPASSNCTDISQCETVTTNPEPEDRELPKDFFSSTFGCFIAPNWSPHFPRFFYSLVLLLKYGLNADPRLALYLGRWQGKSLLF